MTVVGDKQVLATETLLLADDEIGEFTVPVGEANGSEAVSFRVAVHFTAPDASEGCARWVYDRGVLKMVFSGWGDRNGSTFGRAQRLGDHNGIPIGFNLAHQRFGELNQVTLQFYIGGTYG